MSKARVVLVSHHDEVRNNRVLDFFRANGVPADIRRPFKGDALGSPDGSVIASVVFGGPFNVFDETQYPFLHDEHAWIEACMKRDIPLLGICQGAQSIARVLGAAVGPKPDGSCEFGYYDIMSTPAGQPFFPERLVVTQAHYHEFAVPGGAELLATGRAFCQQAFRYGRNTFAFQFHADVTKAEFRRWQVELSSLYDKPGSQTRRRQDELAGQHDEAQHAWFMTFQDALFAGAIRDAR